MSVPCIQESFIFSSAIQHVQADYPFIHQGAVVKEHLSFLALTVINFGTLISFKYTLKLNHHKSWDSR